MTGSLADTEESRAFLQQRLGFFARTITSLFGLVLVGELGLFVIFPEDQPKRIHFAQLLVGVGLLFQGLTWLVLKRQPFRAPLLRALDASIMVIAGLLIGLGGALVAETPTHLFVPYSVGIL